jgi:hypothetical protein
VDNLAPPDDVCLEHVEDGELTEPTAIVFDRGI